MKRTTLYGRSSGPLRLAGNGAVEPAGDGAVGVWLSALPGRAARLAAPRPAPSPRPNTARRPTPPGCSGSPLRWSIALPFTPPLGQCVELSAPTQARLLQRNERPARSGAAGTCRGMSGSPWLITEWRRGLRPAHPRRAKRQAIDLRRKIAGRGGAEGIRTPGLLIANEALSQLSYSPVPQGADNAQRPRRSQATQGSCKGSCRLRTE